MGLSEVERAWLNYAWRVVNWPKEHAGPCLAAGGLPQSDTPEGRHNDLRWPGYVGRDYKPERGVLCVAAVGQQPKHYTPDQAGGYAEMARIHRAWLERGRSEEADRQFLESHRDYYERALPTWKRWRQVFRGFVEDHLRMDRREIAYGNLAKCRARDVDTVRLARVCQAVFPASEMVAALRPAAVVVAVVSARPGGGTVRTWRGNGYEPFVWTFEGRNARGQDGRGLNQWAPDVAREIRSRLA